MKCKKCNRPMSPIFISMACDYCDGIKTLDTPFSGYVVWSDSFKLPFRAYVFSSPDHAKRWLEMRGPEDASIRRVVSAMPFSWRSGVQSTSDLEFADSLVEIHLDSRYEPAPHKAHLV